MDDEEIVVHDNYIISITIGFTMFNPVTYALGYTARLFTRRAVHVVLNELERGGSPRSGRNRNENGIRGALSDSQQISSKNDLSDRELRAIHYAQSIVNPTPPRPRAPKPVKEKKQGLWSMLVEGFQGAPKPAPMVESKAVWTDSRGKVAKTIVAMPLSHDHDFALRVNGSHTLGRIDGQLSLTNTSFLMPSNDTRDFGQTNRI